MFRCSRKFSAGATQQKPFENSQQQGVQMVGASWIVRGENVGKKTRGDWGSSFPAIVSPRFFFLVNFSPEYYYPNTWNRLIYAKERFHFA